MRVSGSRFRRWAIPVVAFLVVATGCGSRSDRDDEGASGQPTPAEAITPSEGAGPSANTDVSQPDPAVPAPAAQSGAVPSSGGSARPAGATGSTSAGRGTGATGTAATPGTGPAASAGGAQPGSTPTPGAGGGQPGQSGPAAPVNAGPKSPLVLASVGTYSGPVGVVLSAILYGGQMWVKQTNARGGLNGHQIQLIAFDDGGDPARHRAQLQTAIEQKKALALFAQAEVFTGEGSVEYINQKRIPIIGTDNGEAWAYRSPMYFMQGSSGDYLVYTMLTTAAGVQVPLGKTKLGLLACAEVGSCQRADDIRAQHAQRLGFQTVYTGKASIAQPDFTAECLSAKNAGTQTLIVVMDANSLGRVAASCARQDFHPTYVNVAGNLIESLAENPNFENLLGNSSVAPFFQTGTPATDEFQLAVKNYGGNATVGVGLITGWVAGKMLERAGAQLPEPPTTEAILKGLWSIKNDNLGGLSSQPLTFTENEPLQGMACWYALQVKKGAWTSPDGFTAHCDSTKIH